MKKTTNMKKIVTPILITILLVNIFTYLAGVFILKDFNPLGWPIKGRAMYVVVLATAGFIKWVDITTNIPDK